jgi:hypothetical protein
MTLYRNRRLRLFGLYPLNKHRACASDGPRCDFRLLEPPHESARQKRAHDGLNLDSAHTFTTLQMLEISTQKLVLRSRQRHTPAALDHDACIPSRIGSFQAQLSN